ncbi:MAG: FixH family protein [Planctomycetes bacterium]|nr:FixH family protein [Planctomycetota bacterium]
MTTNQKWRFVPVVFIGANMLIVAITVYFANADGGYIVEPSYDEKAQNFEQTIRRDAASRALEWKLDLSESAGVVQVDLRNSAGNVIDGVKLQAIAFHNAHAASRQTLQFAPTAEPGKFTAKLADFREGLWTFRVEASDAKGNQYTTTLERKLVRTGGGA